MRGAATELVLVRHGRTRLNREGRYQGWIDPPLDDGGAAQARRVGEGLRRDGFFPETVWTSDLRRSRETAELVLRSLRVAGRARTARRQEDPRLRELSFGAWEGRTWEESRALDPARFDGWIEDPEGTSPPGGETLAELRRRVDSWLDGSPVLAAPATPPTPPTTPAPGPGVLVVGHGGPLGILLARMLALPPTWAWESRLRPDPASVVRLLVHDPPPPRELVP